MRALLFLVLGALALAGLANADHCSTWSTAHPEVAVATFYVDLDICPEGNVCAVWVYEESNDVAGLQRDDEVASGTCHGMIAPDTIVF